MALSKHVCRSLKISLSAIAVLSVVCGANSQLAHAQEYEGYADGYKPITNDQFFGNGRSTPVVNLFRAELAIRSRNWDQAIVYLRESMTADDDDIDTHKYLALCLEEKMKQEPEHDPEMYKECVKEWLIVLRNMKGPEKGMTFKNGISPRNTAKWGDEEGSMMASQHLLKLTGSVPKRWETNNKYLVRVAKPAEEIVTAKVVSKKKTAAAPKEGVDQ